MNFRLGYVINETTRIINEQNTEICRLKSIIQYLEDNNQKGISLKTASVHDDLYKVNVKYIDLPLKSFEEEIVYKIFLINSEKKNEIQRLKTYIESLITDNILLTNGCDKCGKKFINKYYLYRHKNRSVPCV